MSLQTSPLFPYFKLLANTEDKDLSLRYRALNDLNAKVATHPDAALILLLLLRHLPDSDPLRMEVAHLASLLPTSLHK